MRLNVGSDHLSRIKNGKYPTYIDEGLPNVQPFSIGVVDDHFGDIIHFLSTDVALEGHTTQQKKELVVQDADFFVIAGHLYNMGLDEVLHQHVPKYERHGILVEAHGGVAGGQYA